MDARSIKDEVIGLLTQHRELTSAERAEIDTLGLAMSLKNDDPMWGSVIWAWAVLPRKEYIDIAHRALAAEIRSDLKDAMAVQHSIGGDPMLTDGKLDEIKTAIEALTARSAAPVNQDMTAIKQTVIAAIDAKKGVISVDTMLRLMHSVAREFVSWTVTAIAAIAVGLSLFIGFQFGKYAQSSNDEVAMQRMERQISDLTAALPKR